MLGGGGGEKVGPFEDFGEAVGVEAMDDGGDGGFGADDEEFDGFAIALGVAVEFEGEFEADGFGGLRGGGEEGVSLHGCHLNGLQADVKEALMRSAGDCRRSGLQLLGIMTHLVVHKDSFSLPVDDPLTRLMSWEKRDEC